MLSVGSGAPVFIAEYEKSTAIDLASSEGMDGVKVDNDRLGQLRGLGRHEVDTSSLKGIASSSPMFTA